MGSQGSTERGSAPSGGTKANGARTKQKPQDHYEILGVDQEATYDEIKRASVLSHPLPTSHLRRTAFRFCGFFLNLVKRASTDVVTVVDIAKRHYEIIQTRIRPI